MGIHPDTARNEDSPVRQVVRPFMAVTGWVALIILLSYAFMNGTAYPPEWMMGLLTAPGAVYLTDRTVRKYK